MAECILTKRLLVLGGSRQALAGLKQIKAALDVELAICDMDAAAPGFELADYQILASVYHLDQCLPAVLEFHKTTPVDGVMCLACDVPHIVARIAEALNLPGIPVEAADLAVNKLAMKNRFERDGVSVPRYAQISGVSDILRFKDKWKNLVIKPSDSRGSKGVSLYGERGNSEWAFAHAKAASPSGTVMVEQYLSGPQLSTESIVIDGHVVTPALCDRSYPFLEKYAPFIVENGGDMPSNQPMEILDEVRALLQKAATSMGIQNGVVKGDIVVHQGQPYIIELAARLSGGYFCTHLIPFSTGVYLVEAVARLALGEKLDPRDWQAKAHRYVSSRWLIPDAGRVTGFTDPDVVRALPDVLVFESWAEKGQVIGGAENAAASVAMVQATGKSREEAIMTAERALDAFAINVEPAV